MVIKDFVLPDHPPYLVFTTGITVEPLFLLLKLAVRLLGNDSILVDLFLLFLGNIPVILKLSIYSLQQHRFRRDPSNYLLALETKLIQSILTL